ncbi:hypothetical protein Pfo_025537 [Paulownia fortunei]|nr:hypothetical protein Pfo_025537 [Paulownia fortunei]
MQNPQNSLFAILIISLACSYFISPTFGNAELRALMAMKSSLDPENKYLSSWTADGDPCGGAFEGVACNEHRKVANISLQGKGLAGKVPPAVAELKCLSGLYLHYNSLSGEIPKEIANLTELTDLYLNVNNLTGSIPAEIGSMASLQVLQLCCNHLTGSIPTEMGFLKRLSVLALESNRLTGQIPARLGDLGMMKRLYLSFNQLSGPIPDRLANIPSLEVLDVQNNTLSGVVPPALRRINEGFHFDNNPGLCGTGFSSLRACTAWDNLNINQIDSSTPVTNRTAPTNIPQSATFPLTCNQSHCSKSSSKLPQIAIVAGVITLTVTLMVAVFVGIVRHRRRKQKVGNKSDTSDDRLSIDQAKDIYKRSPSPLVALEYSNGWDPTNAAQDCNGLYHEFLQVFNSKFNLEEVESATQHFSDVNLLGKSKFSAVYKGILKDGSVVAIKSINKTSCKTEEDEFMKGLSLLNSLKHENLVKLKGFCCSKARGECFLIYDFAWRGNLSQYLDAEDDGSSILDWPTRVSIIHGIAKGIEYLHSHETNKPPIIHQNISVEKVLLDQQFKPLILDSGLLKLLADDVVYSALKVSAALGYMAPEYITTGRFTEKSDIYAYGVIILQVLCGKRKLSGSMRTAAESGKLEEFIDSKLKGKFSETEATRLTKIALDCTNEIPHNRPSIASVVQELNEPSGIR